MMGFELRTGKSGGWLSVAVLLLAGVSASWASAAVVKHHAAAKPQASKTTKHAATARAGTRAGRVAVGRATAATARNSRALGRDVNRAVAPLGSRPVSRYGSRSTVRPAPRERAAYGTSAQTNSRATVDPESRLDLMSSLADILAHGATGLKYPQALASFYAALAANTAEPASLPVRVLQFGDSHTAADMLSGEARRVIQGQFGNGSVGYTYAGHPFAGYRILGSSRSQSGGWTTQGNHFTDLGDTMTGLGGLAIKTYRAGEWMSEDAPCTSYEVQYLQQPGGGSLQVTDNGSVVGQIDTSTPAPDTSAGVSTTTGVGYAAGSWHYDCPATPYVPHHFVLTTQTDAPVRLLGTVALQPGITWESIGINGAEAPLMLKWEQTLFTGYLAKTTASLIVLAYGTNEAAAKWTYEGYSEVFARLVDKLHATLPNASILVMGPGDRAIGMALGRGRRKRVVFSAYSGTARIVEAQRDVCRTHGCAFWDWQQRMGGFGSMQRWVRSGWAQPDHTHFTGEGYRSLADALLADVLSGYDSYRAAHGLPVQPLRGTPTATPPSTAPQPASGAAQPIRLPPTTSPQTIPQ